MKTLKLLALTLSGMIYISCDDFLTQIPSSTLPPEESVTSIKDLESAVNGILSYAINREYYGGDFIAYADLKGSDFYSVSQTNQISPVGRYNHDQFSSFVEGYYSVGYEMLARINEVLTHVSSLPAVDDRNELEGELIALRALVQFDLARLFAKLPSTVQDLNAANSGIPPGDKLYPVDHKATRSTLKETYNVIISDFSRSLSLMSATTAVKTNGRINHWAAKALRARAYLYLEMNSEALSDAIDVINNSPYSLLDSKDYEDSWKTEGASETLFEILTTDLYNAQRNSMGYYCTGSGYGEVVVRDAFLALMKSVPNDVRASIIKAESDSYPGNYPKKYPGRNGQIYVNNLRVIRLPEVYLIAAEARLKGGTANGALQAESYINTLLSKRISGYNPVLSVTLDDILTERRKELFAEGHMCWDMWRNKKSVDNATLGTVNFDNDFCILPFPQREIDISKGLVQNPGY